MSPLIPAAGSRIANRASGIDLQYACSANRKQTWGDVGEFAEGELALGVCGYQMIENALRLPLREPRHRGEFGD